MRTLKINLLYACTAKCSHCRFGCTNEGNAELPDFDTPWTVAKKLKEHFGLDMAVVLGGEPTICSKDTVALLQRLSELGIATRLETNGCWAGSYEEAVAFLTPLKESGTSIMLSLDGFHDPFIPLQNIVHAVQACVELGMYVNLEMPYLDIGKKNHPIDRRTMELYRAIQTQIQGSIPIYEGGILFIGRAAEVYGDQFAQGKGIPTEVCTAVPWWMDSAIDSTDLLILEPGGYLTKGCGIAIGNVLEQDPIEMLEQYDARKHPVFSVLMSEGPYGLAKMAQEQGYRLKQDYADKCHLCHEARQILKPYFDKLLQPNQHYPSFQ